MLGGDVLAICPKCGVEIKRFDLAPNCKNCGVNIYYYSQEKVLATDAKRTELESADARALVARIKGNFIGGKVQIARIVFIVLSIAVLCIPFFGITISMPMSEIGFSVGIIGVVNMITSSVYNLFPALFNLKIGGSVTTCAVITMAAFIVLVLLLVAMFVVMLLSFLNPKKHAKILAGLSFAGIAADIVAFAAMLSSRSAAQGLTGISVPFSFGAIASAAMLIVFGILNVKMAKAGVEVNLSDVDIKRIELYRKYKAGTLDLDDLPLPVFETDEEREKRENMIAGGKKKKKEKKKKGAEKNG